MRVIKFRAFHKTEKKMYPVAGMLQDIIMLMVSDGCLQGASFSDIELMQYIGENDKNGKPIFEGDIIKHSKEDIGTSLIEDIHAFCGECGINGDNPRDVEIIGNRYETPELLQEGKEANRERS